MFAPPPVLLSIGQIEREKRLQLEREAQRKKATATAQAVGTQDSRNRLKTSIFSRKRASKDLSQLSKEKNKKNKKTDRYSVSDPVSTSPIGPAKKHQERAGERAERKGRNSALPSPLLGKCSPPKRPARPPVELTTVLDFLHSPKEHVAAESVAPAAATFLEPAKQESALPATPCPPPVPFKSPRHLSNPVAYAEFQSALAGLQTEKQPVGYSQEWTLLPDKSELPSTQSIWTPTASMNAPFSWPVDFAATTGMLETSKRANDLCLSPVDMREKRSSWAHSESIPEPAVAIKRPKTTPLCVRRGSEKDTKRCTLESRVSQGDNGSAGSMTEKAQSASGQSPPEIQSSLPERPKSETESIMMCPEVFLQDFLPYGRHQETQSGGNTPDGSSLSPIVDHKIGKHLPDTPGSIAKTPTEMYSARRTCLVGLPLVMKNEDPDLWGRSQRQVPQGCSVSHKLGMTDKGNVLAYQANKESSNAASLSANSRIHTSTNMLEFVVDSARTNMAPLAEVDGRESAQLTTTKTPEKKAYRPPIYMEGPLRLWKFSDGQPHSSSIGSPYHFQSLVNEIYQNAGALPQPDVEERMANEICQWFDGYGFGESLTFAGDAFYGDESPDGSAGERIELPGGIMHGSDETWFDDQSICSEDSIPTAHRAAEVQAKGTAGRSGQARRDSSTLPKLDYAWAPRTTSYEAVECASEEKKHVARDSGLGEQGFDWDDDDDDLAEMVKSERPGRAADMSRKAMTKFRGLTGMVVTAWRAEV
ncbi:Hypothetical protein R9X50_00148100 [Acrodontium crateriforme]|uniref:Uncharacterized protein n=1 Tax=Acrodontium crateriforme TaxID=150365 RepID=A0AAQ3M250_9PEZI|nr:Hypothetical protein R9X50_00148100 [Acrodontium crateriforme]